VAASVTVTALTQRTDTNISVVHGLCIGTAVDVFVLDDVYFSTVGAAGPWTSTPVEAADAEYLWLGTGSAAGDAYRIPLALPENADGSVWIKVESTHTTSAFGGHPTLGIGIETYWVCDDNVGSTVVVESVGGRSGIASANTDTIDLPGILAGALNLAVAKIDLSAVEDNPGDIFSINKPFSVSYWVYLNNLLAFVTPLSTNVYAVTQGWGAMIVHAGPAGRIYYEHRDGIGGALQLNSGANVVVAAAWQHIVLTYDGNNGANKSCNMYLQGALVGTSGILVDIGATDSSLLTAGEQNNGTKSINGAMCEIGVWSKELTPAEVTALWNANNGLSY